VVPGALPTSERVPFFARLDETWVKSAQLAWDAFNHDWARNVIGFNSDRQRVLWRDWKLVTLRATRASPTLASVVIAQEEPAG